MPTSSAEGCNDAKRSIEKGTPEVVRYRANGTTEVSLNALVSTITGSPTDLQSADDVARQQLKIPPPCHESAVPPHGVRFSIASESSSEWSFSPAAAACRLDITQLSQNQSTILCRAHENQVLTRSVCQQERSKLKRLASTAWYWDDIATKVGQSIFITHQ